MNDILADRQLRDLIAELESTLALVETAERRARNSTRRCRLCEAATTVDTAIEYLRNLREK
jgi:hypothetical protein